MSNSNSVSILNPICLIDQDCNHGFCRVNCSFVVVVDNVSSPISHVVVMLDGVESNVMFVQTLVEVKFVATIFVV